MEAVEGMLGKLKLSKAEKKGIRVDSKMSGKEVVRDPQVVGKILSAKPIPPMAVVQSVGRVWCPLRGIECKDLGNNHFLITFKQTSGKRRAIDDGPWVVGKDLIVVAEFDGSKTLEEINFTIVPFWVKILKVPLGMLGREAGEILGEEIGEVLAVDEDDHNVSDAGCFLRVKVQIDIHKPLMRGVTIVDTCGGTQKNPQAHGYQCRFLNEYYEYRIHRKTCEFSYKLT